MALAPHTNSDVLAQLRSGMVPTELPLIFGRFTEKSHGHTFEYAERRHPDDNFVPDYPHMIYVGDGQTRIAKVLKTVAWVVIDETENGPVFVKWDIKNHCIYDTSWVRA